MSRERLDRGKFVGVEEIAEAGILPTALVVTLESPRKAQLLTLPDAAR